MQAVQLTGRYRARAQFLRMVCETCVGVDAAGSSSHPSTLTSSDPGSPVADHLQVWCAGSPATSKPKHIDSGASDARLRPRRLQGAATRTSKLTVSRRARHEVFEQTP